MGADTDCELDAAVIDNIACDVLERRARLDSCGASVDAEGMPKDDSEGVLASILTVTVLVVSWAVLFRELVRCDVLLLDASGVSFAEEVFWFAMSRASACSRISVTRLLPRMERRTGLASVWASFNPVHSVSLSFDDTFSRSLPPDFRGDERVGPDGPKARPNMRSIEVTDVASPDADAELLPADGGLDA